MTDEIETCLVRAIKCLRAFVGDYLMSCSIKADHVTITHDEFEAVADDLQTLIKAIQLGVWRAEMQDYDDATGAFLDLALAEFLRREGDAVGCA